MPFNPQDYGLDLTINVKNLLSATDHYVKLVDSLKGDSAKSEAPKLENEDDQKFADNFTVALRRWLFGTIDENPALSIVLVDALASITTDVRNFRSWYIDDAARKGVTVTQTSETDEILAGLKKWIDLYYNGVISFGEETVPDTFKVKTLKDGRIVPDLPRGPNAVTPGIPTKTKGRFVRYSFLPVGSSEVIEIPEGTMADEIAMRYISTPTYRIDKSDIWSALPWKVTGKTPTGRDQKHLDMPKDGSCVLLPFESGLLSAWLPTDSPDVVESDDENEADENEEAAE
jgi:hypothetical protein